MIKTCTRCKWADNDFVNCLSYDGPERADIIFLAEAAGYNEAVESMESGTTMNLVGDAGSEFNKLLNLVGLERQDVITMNSMRCYWKGNKTPSKSEMDACFIYTLKDISNIKPKVIVAMGNSALYQSTGKIGITENRGKLLYSDKLGCKVFPTFHPAAVLWDRRKYETLLSDFRRIPELIDEKPFQIRHYEYKSTNELPVLDGDKLFFDIESTGLNAYKDRITLIQISNGSEPIYLIDPTTDLKTLYDNKKVIGQDYAFDVKFLYEKYGIFPEDWYWDTCIAEYIISGMMNNDLTSLVFKYVPESAGYDDEVKNIGGAHKVTDKEMLKQYGTDDVGVLSKIMKKQYAQLKKMDKLWCFQNLFMPANKVLTKMSLRGVRYDVEKVKEVDKSYNKKANRLLTKAVNLSCIKQTEEHFGKKFNPKSSQQVKHALLEIDQLPVLAFSKKTQAPSVTKNEMEKYAKPPFNNKYCQIMEEYRSIHTIRSNFLSGTLPKLVDGYAHTNYSSHATTTGRPNSKKPNLLNIPRAKDIKQCIISRDGYKFVSADMSQLEVRVAGAIYKERLLIDICNSGRDLHSAITAQTFSKTYEEVYDAYKAGDTKMTELRVRGKTIQFSILYGKGAQGLSYDLGISEEEAGEFIRTYFDRFPNLSKNIEANKNLVLKQLYLDNYFGFRRRWTLPRKDDDRYQLMENAMLREATNFPIQSVSWNLIQLSLIEIDKKLTEMKLKSQLAMQVYDSIIVETIESELDIVCPIVKEIMENINKPYKGLNDVQMKTDVEIGTNLANLKKVVI